MEHLCCPNCGHTLFARKLVGERRIPVVEPVKTAPTAIPEDGDLAEFVKAWNACKFTRFKITDPMMMGVSQDVVLARFTDPVFLSHWRAALAKLPLKGMSDQTISAKWFLTEGRVQEILGGTYDYDRNQGKKPAKAKKPSEYL